MTACRCIYDGVACAEMAQNTVHGYPMCDACAFETLKSTPRRRVVVPDGPVDFGGLVARWGTGK
jgi:hypothetical protein